jgi:hypothetical protein
VGVEEGTVVPAFENLDFFEGLCELELVLGLDALADEPQGVAVCDGGVVVVSVDVISEEGLGAGGLSNERRAGQADLDGIGVGLVEVGEEAALRIVAAVDFVEEVNALELDVVIRGFDDIRIVLELLDVDDGDFELAGIAVDGGVGLDVLGEGLAGVDRVDDETAAAELATGLNQEVDPINDEIKGKFFFPLNR